MPPIIWILTFIKCCCADTLSAQHTIHPTLKLTLRMFVCGLRNSNHSVNLFHLSTLNSVQQKWFARKIILIGAVFFSQFNYHLTVTNAESKRINGWVRQKSTHTQVFSFSLFFQIFSWIETNIQCVIVMWCDRSLVLVVELVCFVFFRGCCHLQTNTTRSIQIYTFRLFSKIQIIRLT